MVTSVFRPFLAALAAVFVFSLSACGGGQEEVKSPTAEFERAIAAEIPATGTPEKATKAPVAKPAAAVQSSGHKASAASQAVAAAPYASFMVGNGKELSSLAAATAPVAPTAESFMDWAESSFPEFFPGGHQVTIVRESFVFRYYPQGNSFLGVTNDGKVYVLFLNLTTELKYLGYMCQLVDVETCRPVVVAELVTPRNGAVDVPLTGTVITVPFDRPVVCPQGPITGTFGVVVGTMTCAVTTTTATVTITVTGEMVESSHVTVTLGGFRSMEGVEMVSYSWSFTMAKKPVVPVVPMVRVVTANGGGDSIGDAGVSIVDPATRAITQVLPDTEPGGYLFSDIVDVDNQRGIAYMGAGATNVLHRVDVKTGTALPSFYIESKYVGTGIHGVAHSTKAVCIATSLWGKQADVSFLRNRFICFDPLTGQKVFNSQDDFLGNSTMISINMIYSGVHQKYYVLMGAESGLIVESYSPGEYRPSYKPGTAGTVVEIDANTYAKGRTWNVNSMPLDGKILGNILYVVNAGDKSLSKIDLSAGVTSVATVNWATTFTGFARPTNIEIDLEKGVYYVSDWWDSVRVMSLATDQQVGHVVLSGTPRGMGIAAGSLWVTTLWLGGKVSEIDRTTRTVKNVLSGVGDAPYDIAIYDNTQP